MKVVISQPMYIPWAGIFNQIKYADVFVHYNDVRLPMGRSFCSRVQIKIKERLYWLTVPLIKNSRGMINQTLIDYSKNWMANHLNKIQQAYSKCKFYKDILDIVNTVFSKQFINICDLNIYMIETISNYLNFKAKFILSSHFKLNSSSSQKILDLCIAHKATEYITGHGARNYLDHELFEQNNIEVKYMKYNICPYFQENTFTPYVTILDLIANTGNEAVNYMQSSTVYWKEFIINE